MDDMNVSALRYPSMRRSPLINILNAIWLARNQARFNNTTANWKSSIFAVSSSISMAGNLTNKTASSKAPKIVEVIWNPPIFNWVKCNIDGSATNTTSACGGIFRDKNAKFLYCFAENTNFESAYHAELSGAMRAIELASQYQWNLLWLECDSALVVR